MHNASRYHLFFCFFFVPTLTHCSDRFALEKCRLNTTVLTKSALQRNRSKSLPMPIVTVKLPIGIEELLTQPNILTQTEEYSSSDERSALVSNTLKSGDFKKRNRSSSKESSNDDSSSSSGQVKQLLEKQKRQESQKTFSVNNKPSNQKYNIPTSPGAPRRHTAMQRRGQVKNNNE
jgi:hypothetical protein